MLSTSIERPIHIAIADDHNLVREGIIAIMSKYERLRFFISAANGAELLQCIEKADRMPDVCILDINMPELNGYQAITALSKQYPEIKVLVLSTHDDEFSILKMMQLGACGYLIKDCEPEELYIALCEITNTGQYLSRSVVDVTSALYESRFSKLKSYLLTKREILFLHFCCTDLSYKEIADKMHVSPRTVDDYRIKLFRKIKVRTRVGLAVYAIQTGIEAFYSTLSP